MPVIRGPATMSTLTPEDRAGLLEALSRELSGQGAAGGPVIFEIPLDQLDLIDVLVVWDAFLGLRSEERTSLILDAYGLQSGSIAQALGVTYEEAMEQSLLPYAVVPMMGILDDEMRSAMIKKGGIPLSQTRVELRFPTMPMAEAAHRWLWEKSPHGQWSIVQSFGGAY